jgi:hypothetical protein
LSPTPTPSATTEATVDLAGNTLLYPNPADGTVPVKIHHLKLQGVSDVRVQIFTITQRKVQDLVFNQVAPGEDLAFSTTDKWGVNLANGLYYVVVTTEQSRWIGKLILLR